MLTECWECEELVEIRDLENHLINSCPSKNDYKFDEKCKQLILKVEESSHKCELLKPLGSVRCPLCSLAVSPNNEEGWRTHLLK